MADRVAPVILAGGSGTRLWPLSRKSYPKQFTQLIAPKSLFQQTSERHSNENFERPMVVTNADFRFIVTEQLSEIGIDPGDILIEPEARNTAPAILAAALHVSQKNPRAIMMVLPSDHIVSDLTAYQNAVSHGINSARQGNIVTFGVKPDRPETGFGYLELSDILDGSGSAITLNGFVEKPSQARAIEMIAAENYLWNGGIFMFQARDFVAAVGKHAPHLMAPVKAACAEAVVDLGFLRLAPGPWKEAEAISVDYAVMEKAENLMVVPLDCGWSDLGDWDAVWRETPQDDHGVAAHGQAMAIACEDTLLWSDDPRIEVVGIGLKNIVTIAMNDAVLVSDRSCTQEVKQAVEALKAKSASQATNLPKDFRPWGWYDSLIIGERFQVKRIVVHPGAALSLQSHHHRSEHWIVVEGTAKVTIDDDVKIVTENQSVYIPLGAVHRMENPGKLPMVLIEVQTGSYLKEDDIIRYEDVYART